VRIARKQFFQEPFCLPEVVPAQTRGKGFFGNLFPFPGFGGNFKKKRGDFGGY